MISTSPSLPHFIFPYSHRHFTVLHTVLHYSRSFFFMCPLFRIPFPLLWTYCSSLAAVVFASFSPFFTHWTPFSLSPSFVLINTFFTCCFAPARCRRCWVFPLLYWIMLFFVTRYCTCMTWILDCSSCVNNRILNLNNGNKIFGHCRLHNIKINITHSHFSFLWIFFHLHRLSIAVLGSQMLSWMKSIEHLDYSEADQKIK